MSCFSVVLGDERQSNGTHERFLRREITPNNAHCAARAAYKHLEVEIQGLIGGAIVRRRVYDGVACGHRTVQPSRGRRSTSCDLPTAALSNIGSFVCGLKPRSDRELVEGCTRVSL